VKKSLLASIVLFSLCTFVASAHATPFAPLIDFRDGALWSGADHQTSFSGNHWGIDLTVSASPSPATLWWDGTDGLGIRLSYEDDEVESHEILGVSFQQGVALSAIYISDLFVEDGYAEKGSYRIDGGAWVAFDANTLPGSNSNGERLILFGAPVDDVHFVEFSAPGKINGEDHEFALMGFDAAVSIILAPEPNTAALVGAGLLMVAAWGRRS
jgi:hypothetical protein